MTGPAVSSTSKHHKKEQKKEKKKFISKIKRKSKHEAPRLTAAAETCVSRSPKTSSKTNPQFKRINFDIQYVLAPMVGASELAFRILCRNYGAQASYTPMMSAAKFADDAEYRRKEFQTHREYDHPLVCHVAANDPQDFARACVEAARQGADAMDLNLGCPQRTAYLGHFGSYLLDPKDRSLICDIVRAGCRAAHGLPIFCKIRLLDTLEETLELCYQLRDAGVALIAIHARYRATWDRKGPGARDGPALLDQVAAISREITDIPIISNGNIITFQDVEKNLGNTGAAGVMSAEGLLDDPTLYFPRYCESKMATVVRPNDRYQSKLKKYKKKWSKTEAVLAKLSDEVTSNGALSDKEWALLAKKEKILDSLNKYQALSMERVRVPVQDLAHGDAIRVVHEYLDLVDVYPVAMRSVVFHTRRILKRDLEHYQLMEDCLNCTSVEEIRLKVLARLKHYRIHPESFAYDQSKAQQQKEALERKKREEGKRKAFEARMVRKAKREGRADLQYYLHKGVAVPTLDLVKRLKTLSKEDALQLWKEGNHAQHCLAFHTGGCQRGRGCAFLHMDAQGRNVFEEADEVAG